MSAQKIAAKFPSIFKKGSNVSAEYFAKNHGFSSLDDMLVAFDVAPSERILGERILKQKARDFLKDDYAASIPEDDKNIVILARKQNAEADKWTPESLREYRDNAARERRNRENIDFSLQEKFDTWYNNTPIAQELGITYDGKGAGGSTFTMNNGLVAGITKALHFDENGEVDTQKFYNSVTESFKAFADEIKASHEDGDVITKMEKNFFSPEFIAQIEQEVRDAKREGKSRDEGGLQKASEEVPPPGNSNKTRSPGRDTKFPEHANGDVNVSGDGKKGPRTFEEIVSEIKEEGNALNTEPAEPSSAGQIEDVGEKLHGSRKDLAQGLKAEVADDDIASQPLSKTWPKMNPAKMQNDFVSAFVWHLRSIIPAKPRTEYKLNRWTEIVKNFRNMAKQLLNGEISEAQAIKTISEIPQFRNIGDIVKVYQLVSPELWPRIKTVNVRPDNYTYNDNDEKVPRPSVVVNGKYFDYRNDIVEVTQDVRSFLVSIHAPRAGGDFCRKPSVTCWPSFNPRPPCGGRQT